MSSWFDIVTPVSDVLKRIFGIIDQVVEDKDKRNELKISIALAEANSRFWLAACWRPLAFLGIIGMIIVLEIMGRVVPEYAYVIAGLGLVGHLLTKENVAQAKELFKATFKHKKEKK